MFTCRRCGGERRGDPVRIAFFVYDQECGELLEGYLSKDMTRSIEEDICAECARQIRGMMKRIVMPEENRASKRGRKSTFKESDETRMLTAYRKGMSMREIAEEWNVCQATVSTHIRRALSREQKSGL